MDTLRLEYGYRKGEIFEGRSTKTERKYLNFIVSEQSLKQRCGADSCELIGKLGWIGNKKCENQQIDELLGLVKPVLLTGRTALYVCPECGDIGCGAITAKIVENDKTIIWKDFGYENDYSEPSLTEYEQVGPFEFDKAAYRQMLEEVRTVPE